MIDRVVLGDIGVETPPLPPRLGADERLQIRLEIGQKQVVILTGKQFEDVIVVFLQMLQQKQRAFTLPAQLLR